MTDSQAIPQPPASAKLAADDEIDLLDYLRVIWRYRGMILVLCLIAMSLTVVLALREPRQYQSAVVIVPPLDILQKASGGGFGSINNSLLRQIIDPGAVSITGIYVQILQSREVADAVVDRLHLMDTSEGTLCRSSARDRLKTNTTIKTMDGGAVKVTIVDRDPNRVAAIANIYIEELDKRNKRLSASQATSKRVFLENRLKEVEAKLSKIDNTLIREAKTQEGMYQLLVEQYEMAKIEEAKSMPTIQVLDAAVVPELPMGRGTVRKGMMAGVGTFVLGVLLAFGREYVSRVRRHKGEVPSAGKDGPKGGAVGATGFRG